jgi:hypothetical protein
VLFSSAQLVDFQQISDPVFSETARSHLLARVEHSVNVVLSDNQEPKLRIIGYTVTPSASGQIRVDMFFESLASIGQDYIVSMHGTPLAGTALPADREPYGFANWDQPPSIPTSQWRSGSIYISSHILENNLAGYDIFVSLWEPESDTRLKTSDSKIEIPLR